MLDFIGTIVLVAAIIVSINALTGAMPISASQRIALSARRRSVDGPGCRARGREPVPRIKSGGAADDRHGHRASAGRRRPLRRRSRRRCARSLLGMPMPFLIGLNVWRSGGRIFPPPRGRRPACRAISILRRAGATSSPARWLCRWPGSRCAGKAGRWSGRWNAFGMLDLVAALALGIISANGSPLQIIHAGRRLGGGAAAAVVADSDRAGADVPDRARGHFRRKLARGRAGLKPDGAAHTCIVILHAGLWITGSAGTSVATVLRRPRDRGSIGTSYGDGKPSRTVSGSSSRLPRFAAAPIRIRLGDRPPVQRF